MKSVNNSLLIAHVNIVSLQKNFDRLNFFLNQFAKPVDILCRSKTRLNGRNLNYCNLPGYNMFYCNSKTKAGRSAIYVADRQNCHQILQTEVNDKFCEVVWVKIGLDKNETLIMRSIYRHPTNDFKCFEDAYLHVLKSFKSSQEFFILGDCNINYNKIDNSHGNISSYANHIYSVGCVQLINKPTCITTTASSTIDQIYTNSALINQETKNKNL